MTPVEIIGIVLMCLGFILIVVEMLLPGFGFPGISGGISLIVGIFMKSRTFEEGLTYAVIAIVASAVAMTIIVVFFHSKKIKPPVTLDEEMTGEVNFIGSKDLEVLVGREGITLTDLRPAGKIDIDGVTFDVRSEGPFVEKGKKVKIERIQGGSLVVK